MEFLARVNWVDIVVALVAVRIVYISIKTGFGTELIKMLGTVCALFVTFHYYTDLAALVRRVLKVPEMILQVSVFLTLWLLIFLMFKLLRDGILVVFKVQTISVVDKWGAVLISVIRSFVTASMLLFVLLVADQAYIQQSIKSSLLGKKVLAVASDMYGNMIGKFVIKLFPEEGRNPAVRERLSGI